MKHSFVRSLSLLLLVFGVGAILVTSASRAQVGIDPGDEIFIDGPQGDQPGGAGTVTDAAVDEMGRSIFAWEVINPPTGQAIDIFLRRFDEAGIALEEPLLANATTADAQRYPRVVVAADGTFLVVWQSQENDPDVGFNRSWVRTQLFDVNGDPVGAEERVNDLSTALGTDISADAAALRVQDGSSGGFVVVWESLNTDGDDDGLNIQARLVSAGGAPLGSQFQVNTDTGGQQTTPAVSELADGGFLVVWQSVGAIKGQRYTDVGVPVDNEFLINQTFPISGSRPDAALGWDGIVAVVWEDDEGLTADDSEIRTRLYDPDLNPLGPDFRVNTLITDTQTHPRLGDYGPKGFLVTWESDFSVGDDPDNSDSIQARLVSGQDTFDGPQIQYNVWVQGGQILPASGGWYGRLASSWNSAGNEETNALVETGRQILYCLFCDDFEWGSSWRWSRTEP